MSDNSSPEKYELSDIAQEGAERPLMSFFWNQQVTPPPPPLGRWLGVTVAIHVDCENIAACAFQDVRLWSAF